MIGIVGRDICSIRGFETGKIDIDVDKAGLYPATPALVSVSGKRTSRNSKGWHTTKGRQRRRRSDPHQERHALPNLGHLPYKDLKVWYQLLGNLDPEAPVSTRDEAYE